MFRLGLSALVLLICGVVFADYWSAVPLSVQPTFVGRSACVDCHQDETSAFTGSHHDLAMDIATDETVIGDFNDVTFEHDGLVNRLFRDGERFMVHTEGEDGKMRDFEVKYVFGVDPLQQYMVEFDRTDDMDDTEVARVQVLRISWDTNAKRWFYLRPPDVDEKLVPDDPLHWTGIAQRWQTMCADCHSTNLKRNFDPEVQKYHTTFSEIDVSCEACHGPGSLHVELANKRSLFWDRNHGYGLARLKGDDAEPQLQTCAPCHSRRGLLDEQFTGGKKYFDHYQLELLMPETYHADGQIKDEVYVYGSFIQSKMYHKGIRCTDCHDPHSLKLKFKGNETCTSCHQHAAGKYDVVSHHHHEPGTPGAMCVNCHMPHTTYMEVDPRRDHSLRVPRPDLSVKIGTPNACSGCHVKDNVKEIPKDVRPQLQEYADWLLAAENGDDAVEEVLEKTNEWCDAACEKWYGSERKKPLHFAEPLAAFRAGKSGAVRDLLRLVSQPDELAPAIARATALSELGNAGIASALPKAKEAAKNQDEHPLVRAAAVNVYMNAPPQTITKDLLPLLDDPTKLVRNEAARVLVASGAHANLGGSARSKVELATRSVADAMMVASDRSGAHMGWAGLLEQQGRYQEAIDAYATAIRVEPKTAGPRTNLAALLEGLAQQTQGVQSAKMLEQASQLRKEELPLLARDADLAAENAFVQYRYGLALYLDGQLDKSLKQLKRAVELEPDVEQFQTALQLLKERIENE